MSQENGYIAHIPNHVERGLDNLLCTFSNSTILRGLVEGLMQVIQEGEDTLYSLLYDQSLDNAAGDQLDRIGAKLGEDRLGRGDTEYREAIITRIFINQSSGGIDEILEIFNRLFDNPEGIVYSSLRVAEFTVEFLLDPSLSETDKAYLTRQLLAAIAAGVRFNLVEYSSDYFGFNEDANALGFDEGRFANLLTSPELQNTSI